MIPRKTPDMEPSPPHNNPSASQYSQLRAMMMIGNDAPRKQLRDSLLTYLQVATCPAIQAEEEHPKGSKWALTAASPAKIQDQPPGAGTCSGGKEEVKELLVGDSSSLLATLHDFAEQCRLLAEICHHNTDPAQALVTVPHSLEWLVHLTKPAAAVTADTDPSRAGLARVLDLLRLRDACAPPAAQPAPSFDELSPYLKREHAFQLARELPFFDRDITAYYMEPILAANPHLPEYELHAAHSLLRLSPSSTTTLAHFTSVLFPAWREQGLLHVLTVVSAHMPCPVSDWNNQPASEALATLLKTLPLARSYEAATRSIAHFIAHSHPNDLAAVMHTLDTAAVLMRIKSNAPHHDPKAHSLGAALASFPTPEQCTLNPDLLPKLWASIKPAIERSLPPSLLLAPPAPGTVW